MYDKSLQFAMITKMKVQRKTKVALKQKPERAHSSLSNSNSAPRHEKDKTKLVQAESN